MIDVPELLTTTPQQYACIPLTIPLSAMREEIGSGCAELSATLRAQGLAPAGPWFTHHFRRPTDTFDFEICFPVATPVSPAGRVEPGLWAATRVARTVYHGNYAELPHAWGEMSAWLQNQGLAGREEFWEVYLTGPTEDPAPDHWRTQLNWPLR